MNLSLGFNMNIHRAASFSKEYIYFKKESRNPERLFSGINMGETNI